MTKRTSSELTKAVEFCDAIRSAVTHLSKRPKIDGSSSHLKDGFTSFLELKQANRSVRRQTNKQADEAKRQREKLAELSLEIQVWLTVTLTLFRISNTKKTTL
jgi:hypothetical protein